MKSILLPCVLLMIVIISTTGCIRTKHQSNQLDIALDSYATALRWGHYEDAASFHISPDGKAGKINLQYLENFSVVSFIILSKSLVSDPDNDTITTLISAELSYYHKERGVLNKIKLNQKWWYSPSYRGWLTMSDFLEFK